jgi:hypothetical protein
MVEVRRTRMDPSTAARTHRRRNRRPPHPPLRTHPARTHPPGPPMMKPCIDCGTPTNDTRCPTHTNEHDRAKDRGRARHHNEYGRAKHRGEGARVRATATRCHICGQGPKPNDPWQADHLIPLANNRGGGGPLLPAHRSCNIARSNKLRAGKPDPSPYAITNHRRGTPQPSNTTDRNNSNTPHTPHPTAT